jgi:hypothetical protein
MMELYAAPQLEEFQPWAVLQQDAAPPHWGLLFRQFLHATFENRWTGRDGATTATTFTEHYPSGLVFNGGMFELVYSTPVPDIDTLKARIKDALVAVTEEMLEKTWREMEYRLDVLRATNGAYGEVY